MNLRRPFYGPWRWVQRYWPYRSYGEFVIGNPDAEEGAFWAAPIRRIGLRKGAIKVEVWFWGPLPDLGPNQDVRVFGTDGRLVFLGSTDEASGVPPRACWVWTHTLTPDPRETSRALRRGRKAGP